MLSDSQVPAHLANRSWLIDAGRNGSGPREAYFRVNNILGLVRACQQGLGIAALPDYLVEKTIGSCSYSANPTRSSSTPISSIRRVEDGGAGAGVS